MPAPAGREPETPSVHRREHTSTVPTWSVPVASAQIVAGIVDASRDDPDEIDAIDAIGGVGEVDEVDGKRRQ